MRSLSSQLSSVVSNIALAAVLAASASTHASAINWRHDLATAQAEAQQTGKPILIHFWTPTCGPCKRLERTVFNQASVAQALEQQFVPVKINAEAMPAVARQYAVFQWPTDVVTTPQGHAIGKMISPPTPTAYISQVSHVANRFKSRLGAGFDQAVASATQPPASTTQPPASTTQPPASTTQPSKLNSAYAGLSLNSAPPVQAQQSPPLAAATKPPAAPMINPHFSGPAHFAGPPPVTSPATVPFVAAQNTPPVARYQPKIQGQPNPQDRYAMAPPKAPAAAVPAITAPAVTPPVASAPVFPAAPPVRQANPYFAQASTPVPPQAVAPVARPTNQQLAGAPPIAPVAPANVVTPEVTPAVSPQRAPKTPPLGFDGFCPVSMKKDWRWIKGDPRWGIVHRGRTYLFNSAESRDEFWQKPDFYSPALSGNDPVLAIDRGQSHGGTREHSLEYGGQFYMFATEASLQQFSANPGRYVAGVRQAMGLDASTIRR